jgi:hypothetical protein
MLKVPQTVSFTQYQSEERVDVVTKFSSYENFYYDSIHT